MEETAAEDVGAFLADHDLKIADIDAFLLHPGGTKVLEAYEKALALEPAQLAICPEASFATTATCLRRRSSSFWSGTWTNTVPARAGMV